MEKEKLLHRLDELIDRGKIMIEPNNVDMIPEDQYDEWSVNIENLLRLIYPDRIEAIKNEFKAKAKQVNKLGVAQYKTSYLKATEEDLSDGYIGNLEYKIRKIEIKSLLDYSFQLLDENDDALDRCACVLSRIVLEKALQMLCDRRGLDSTKKASVLNQQLWQDNCYPQAQWRHINTLLDVGNSAAHSGGDWEQIGKEQRKRTVREIEDFTKDIL